MFFRDLEIKGKNVLLDVDGVLVPDALDVLAEGELKSAKELNRNNKVLILSNNRDLDRVKKISIQTGIEAIETSFKKPNPRTVEGLEFGNNTVVVGDKMYTDGLLAARIGGEFIKVKRLIHKKDRLWIKVSYFLDNIFSLPLKWFIKFFV